MFIKDINIKIKWNVMLEGMKNIIIVIEDMLMIFIN